MRVLSWSLFLLVSIFFSIYLNQANAQNDCAYQETCKACIRTPDCVWCNKPNDDSPTAASARCAARNNAEQQKNNWCNERDVIDQKKYSNIVKNDAISDSNKTNFIQLEPQIVDLKLRRGEEYRLKIKYKQALDYPVDLYFVADLSWSMRPFWKALKELGGKIVTTMRNLTKNFRLGFGSFIDKNIRPMTADKLKWDGYFHYAFKNHLSLQENKEPFEKEVGKATDVGNSDNPECGFDGLMQAMVCNEKINWRSNARHIIVYASDDSPHIAGDGRLAGLPEPNDMECHLNETGYYSHAELQDYPSVGQIRYQAIKNNMNIIFIVVEKFKEVYDEIQRLIPGSSVGILKVDSPNIVDLMEKHYKKLVNVITMTSNSTSNFLDIKYHSKCPGEEMKPGHECGGIRVDNIVEFEVVIKVTDCPEREEDWKQIIEIKPEGINEGVIVNLELICGCECSIKSNETAYAPRVKECSSRGILDCGVCSCDSGSFGKKCECKGGEKLSGTDDSGCRKDNATVICSGQGSCLCGKCNCAQGSNSAQRYSGNYCQCDNLSCPYSKTNKKLCGGNGNCRCGECICHSGWTGRACDCRDDSSRCRPPGGNSKVCSGAGKCECGECKCDKGSNGKFCEDCQSCPSQRCDEFKDCVECKVHKSGKTYEVDKDCSLCVVEIGQVDEIEENAAKVKPGEHVCRIPGDDGSTFLFTYFYNDNEGNDKLLTIVAKRDKDFPLINNFVATTLGVVLLTLLLGFIILLIWKIVTQIHDKREFQKFEKERSTANWGQGVNPLYKTAVQTFQNPTHEAVMKQEDL